VTQLESQAGEDSKHVDLSSVTSREPAAVVDCRHGKLEIEEDSRCAAITNRVDHVEATALCEAPKSKPDRKKKEKPKTKSSSSQLAGRKLGKNGELGDMGPSAELASQHGWKPTLRKAECEMAETSGTQDALPRRTSAKGRAEKGQRKWVAKAQGTAEKGTEKLKFYTATVEDASILNESIGAATPVPSPSLIGAATPFPSPSLSPRTSIQSSDGLEKPGRASKTSKGSTGMGQMAKAIEKHLDIAPSEPPSSKLELRAKPRAQGSKSAAHLCSEPVPQAAVSHGASLLKGQSVEGWETPLKESKKKKKAKGTASPASPVKGTLDAKLLRSESLSIKSGELLQLTRVSHLSEADLSGMFDQVSRHAEFRWFAGRSILDFKVDGGKSVDLAPPYDALDPLIKTMIALANQSLEGEELALIQVIINYFKDGGNEVKRHRHRCHQICASLGATRELEVEGDTLLMRHGDALPLNGELHSVPASRRIAAPRVSVCLFYGTVDEYRNDLISVNATDDGKFGDSFWWTHPQDLGDRKKSGRGAAGRGRNSGHTRGFSTSGLRRSDNGAQGDSTWLSDSSQRGAGRGRNTGRMQGRGRAGRGKSSSHVGDR